MSSTKDWYIKSANNYLNNNQQPQYQNTSKYDFVISALSLLTAQELKSLKTEVKKEHKRRIIKKFKVSIKENHIIINLILALLSLLVAIPSAILVIKQILTR